jgi:hypothetical protein
MNWLSLQCRQDSSVNKVDQRPTRPWIVMEVFFPSPVEVTPASDTSSTASIIGKLCLKPPVNVVHIHFCLKENLNDRSKFALHPAVNNLDIEGHSRSEGVLLSLSSARIPSSGARKVHRWLLARVVSRAPRIGLCGRRRFAHRPESQFHLHFVSVDRFICQEFDGHSLLIFHYTPV